MGRVEGEEDVKEYQMTNRTVLRTRFRTLYGSVVRETMH